ncbi:MAG TPA: translation elongation factor Ts [Gemmatimonadales bacterium]|nr:translation elongation factor Ts [Gemmatimonadales bacterium]
MSSTAISTKDISELRTRTGAGIGDCKNALQEASGDMEKAAEILRKKGIAKAEKRAGRVAAQGVVAIDIAADGKAGAMIELNCETDFVARTEGFQALAQDVLKHVAAHAPEGAGTGADLEGQPFQGQGGRTLGEVVKEISGKTGEAVTLSRWARFATGNGVVASYRHHNGMVGVLVEVDGATGEAATTLAKDVALHVASADPLAVRAEDIPSDMVERERRIAEEQVAQEGKPENIRGKIVEGKVKKFLAERSLLEQPFVREESKTVGQLVKEVPGASVRRFARFKVGEA